MTAKKKSEPSASGQDSTPEISFSEEQVLTAASIVRLAGEATTDLLLQEMEDFEADKAEAMLAELERREVIGPEMQGHPREILTPAASEASSDESQDDEEETAPSEEEDEETENDGKGDQSPPSETEPNGETILFADRPVWTKKEEQIFRLACSMVSEARNVDAGSISRQFGIDPASTKNLIQRLEDAKLITPEFETKDGQSQRHVLVKPEDLEDFLAGGQEEEPPEEEETTTGVIIGCMSDDPHDLTRYVGEHLCTFRSEYGYSRPIDRVPPDVGSSLLSHPRRVYVPGERVLK